MSYFTRVEEAFIFYSQHWARKKDGPGLADNLSGQIGELQVQRESSSQSRMESKAEVAAVNLWPSYM